MSAQRPPSVVVCGSLDEMNERAAEAFVNIAGGSLAASGVFTVALAGGKTPEGLYRLLATDKYIEKVKWEKVHFFWGDERAAGPLSRESNYRMCSEALLEKLKMPVSNIHRIKGENGARAALDYEKEVAGFFKLRPDAFPEFALMLLGMGADGHTASIFPKSAAVNEKNRIAVAVYVEGFNPRPALLREGVEPPQGGGDKERAIATRITLTPPVLMNARNIIFLVSGKDKAEALFKCLEGSFVPEETPAQFARLAKGHVTWIVDTDAASRLSGI